MRALTWMTATLLMLSLASGVSLAGGDPPKRTGLFLGFNLGAGAGDLTMTDEYDPYLSNRYDLNGETGGFAIFRLGGAIRNNLLLGVESSAWVRELNDVTYTMTSMAFAATYYPGDIGFLLRGGFGLGTSGTSMGQGNGWVLSKGNAGLSLIAAAGYEWRLTKKFALVPEVDLAHFQIGKGLVERATIMGATLGLGWYW